MTVEMDIFQFLNSCKGMKMYTGAFTMEIHASRMLSKLRKACVQEGGRMKSLKILLRSKPPPSRECTPDEDEQLMGLRETLQLFMVKNLPDGAQIDVA